MDIGQIFLDILTVVSNAITTLLGMLPNPDPFPAIIESLEFGATDAVTVAYYWIDQFIIADAVISMLGTWFVMFPIAWIIMMLWKWIKAR